MERASLRILILLISLDMKLLLKSSHATTSQWWRRVLGRVESTGAHLVSCWMKQKKQLDDNHATMWGDEEGNGNIQKVVEVELLALILFPVCVVVKRKFKNRPDDKKHFQSGASS